MTITILVIDDEPYNVQLVSDVLEFEGYGVIGTEDGISGVELARAHRPDLIVCDISMPNVDGYDVLNALQQDSTTATIPFIFLTALTERDVMRRGMELGADDFLTKPFKRSDLIKAVKTRLAKHEALAKEAERKLEQAKQNLARMVTHELRTPLTSIDTVMNIISRQFGQLTPQQLQEMLDTMQYGSKRLNRIVEQMVFVTQLETGYLSADKINQEGMVTPLSEILPSAVKLARRFSHRQHDIDIKLRGQENDSALIRCHPMALKHAFAEIVSNALDYSPEDCVVAIHLKQGTDRVGIAIDDQGPGIPPMLQEMALQRYHQIDRALQEQQGMGMGLSLANEIVIAHYGGLEIKSVVGRGTRVIVTLPLAF